MSAPFNDDVPNDDLFPNDPANDVLVRPQSKQRKQPKKAPRYHVVLWNDEEHSYAYVIMMLGALFGYSKAEGRRIAERVDSNGKAIVFTSNLEQAEIKRDQILAFGPDSTMEKSTGPLQATIERDRNS